MCSQSKLPLAPAPSPFFLLCPALEQKGSERDKDMKKHFSLEKLKFACAFREVSVEKWLFGNTLTHFPELGAAFGMTEGAKPSAQDSHTKGSNSLEQLQDFTIQSGMGNVALGAASPGSGETENTEKAAGHDGNVDLSSVFPPIINLLWNPHPICSFPSPGMGGIQPKGGNAELMEVMTYKSQPVVRL